MGTTYTTFTCYICGSEHTIKNTNVSFACETCCGVIMGVRTSDSDDDAVNKWY